MSFNSFLDKLKMEHCEDCEGLTSKCVVVRAINNSVFRDKEYCPACNGWKVGEREIKEGKKLASVRVEGVYAGGWILGLRPDGIGTFVYPCTCEAGKAFSRELGAQRPFDVSEGGLCWSRTWGRVKTKQWENCKKTWSKPALVVKGVSCVRR